MENEFDFWLLSYNINLLTQDLLGQKISAPAGSNIATALEAEGAAPVAVAIPEIFTALMRDWLARLAGAAG